MNSTTSLRNVSTRSTYLIRIGRYSRDELLRHTTFEEIVACFPRNRASWKNPHPSAPENLQPSQVEPLTLTWSYVEGEICERRF